MDWVDQSLFGGGRCGVLSGQGRREDREGLVGAPGVGGGSFYFPPLPYDHTHSFQVGSLPTTKIAGLLLVVFEASQRVSDGRMNFGGEVLVGSSHTVPCFPSTSLYVLRKPGSWLFVGMQITQRAAKGCLNAGIHLLIRLRAW